MPKWLKIEKTDDARQSSWRKEVAKHSVSEDGAREVHIGPGVLLAGLLAVAAIGGIAFVVLGEGSPLGTTLRTSLGTGGGAAQRSGPPSERLASVDGRDITEREVDTEYAVQRFLQSALQGQILDESGADGFRRDLLDRLVDRALLIGAAEEAGVIVDEATYATEMPNIGPGFGAYGAGVTTEMIRDSVVQSEFGLDESDFKRWASGQIHSRLFLSSPSVRDYADRYVALTGRPVQQLTEEVVAAVRATTSDVVFVLDGKDVHPVREGDPAPEITLQTTDGETMSLSSLRGTPVMVNFWATWCGPCRIEMPLFINAHDSHGDDLVVLGVNSQEDPETVTRYVDAMGISFPVILDRDGQTSLVYRVRALPTTFFVDADGIVVRAHRGAIVSRPQLRPLLDEILATAGAGLPGAILDLVSRPCDLLDGVSG